MNRITSIVGAACVLALTAAAGAQQQGQQPPRIAYVYPAGARQGATLDVIVGGQNLDGVASASFTGAGIKAVVLEHHKPVTQMQAGKLRDQVQELLKLPRDPNIVKEIAEIRAKLATFQKRPAPALAETVRLRVTVAPDAELSTRELRLGTPTGVTNPRTFGVGQLAEFSRWAANAEEDPNNFLTFRPGQLQQGNQPRSAAPLPEMSVTLPCVINGQVLPGAVDRYRFTASKGQRLVIAAAARELIPYLADAVPGWFQAAITLRDAKGNEVAYADHFRYAPDPVLYYEAPADGQYELEIHDSIYRGREDFVYRITAGELPYVTGVFPLGCKAGEQAHVELMGWNLGETALQWDAKDKLPGVYGLSSRKGGTASKGVSFAVDSLPECLAAKGNHTVEAAQAVSLPIIINGRIERAGQWDVYRFEGKAAQKIVAEVRARRLGSPLDSVIKLTDSSGKQLAFNDDWEDKGAGLLTHQADSYFLTALPTDGTYFLWLGDTQGQGGPKFAYRLRISEPRPDFALRIAPSSINIRGGSSTEVDVYALRHDGFAGAITLSLKGAPAGITLGGGTIPAGADQVRATLTATGQASAEEMKIAVEGKSAVQGRQEVRLAVPAENMMQAFAYWHLVPAQELDLVVAGAGRLGGRFAARIVSATPVRIPLGGTARVEISLPVNSPRGQIKLDLEDPPEGISIQSVSPAGLGSEIVLKSDAAKTKPGLAGNLIVSTAVEVIPPAAPAAATPGATSKPAGGAAPAPVPAARPNARRVPMGTLPAIPFEIIASQARADGKK